MTETISSDDELGQLLADRAPRPHLPWVTTILAAAILVAAGYVAGGYHYSHKASTTSPAAAFARGGGFGNPTANASSSPSATSNRTGTGGFGGATIGIVKLVDGNNVYLTDATGATIKVTLAAAATVTVSKQGTLADLAPGTAIVVIGAKAADGSVTATAITEGGGTGAFPRGGGAFPGGRGG